MGAAVVTWLLSRLMTPPAPAQLQGTTLGAGALRRAWAADRGLYLGLLGHAALTVTLALALGVR